MFSFVSLDAKSVEPIAIVALAAIAGWFLYRFEKGRQDTAQQVTATGTPLAQQVANVAMLQTLFGQAQSTPRNTGSPTYAAPATATATLGAGSNAGSGAP